MSNNSTLTETPYSMRSIWAIAYSEYRLLSRTGCYLVPCCYRVGLQYQLLDNQQQRVGSYGMFYDYPGMESLLLSPGM